MSRYPSSVVVWEGQSQLNHKPVVLILTGLERSSTNIKTGNMVQAVILDGTLKPTEAVQQGTDESVCGDCPLRKGVCYVNLVPWNQVFRAYSEKKIPHISEEVLERAKDNNRKLRITAYGDPLAVPLGVWMRLLEYFRHHTGYTHQWRRSNLNPRWTSILMASCESKLDVLEASAQGWSTFRVRNKEAQMMNKEIECPHVNNSDVKCANCRLCSGSGTGQRHVVVPVHGLEWKQNNFQQLTADG